MNARRYSRAVTTGQGVRPGGREAQKRRTRNAIVAATRELVAGGGTPSIDEIAAAADVSRRTIYLHFPTLDQLLLDAASGLLAETTVDARLVASEERGEDALARTDALARGLSEVAPSALPLGCKLIALTVDAGPPPEGPVRRGYRRVSWVERALAPVREQLAPERYERLVSALCVVLGWEAMVVLRDIRGLDAGDEEETLRWAARALVQAALDEERGGAS
jgi:AcrR family transcriptional regulator